MPFRSFLGTFNRSQFTRFIAFARVQLPAITARIGHLEVEQARIGTISFTGNDGKGVSTNFTVAPDDSYMAKLVTAYEVLGGNPFLDLRLRLLNQPIFVVKGTEAQGPTIMSNGEAIGGRGLVDSVSAGLMRSASTWIDDTCKDRFDYLERKIRRALDHSDQLGIEIAQLQLAQASASINGSVEFIAEQIEILFKDRNYRTIYDDANGDPLGLKTYAMFSSYDAGGGREAVDPQRGDSGYQGPGEGAGTA